jgi:hypothetical protein
VVERDILFEDDRWDSDKRLPPGTYYVHVSVLTEVFCDDETDPTCEDGEKEEWSNVLELVIPPPQPGKYVGKTFFGQRVVFRLTDDLKTIKSAKATYDIVCQRGGNVALNVSFDPFAIDGTKFSRTAKVKFQGGGQIKFTIRGTMGLKGTASGRLDAKGSLAGPGGGRCNDFGNPTWSAKRK